MNTDLSCPPTEIWHCRVTLMGKYPTVQVSFKRTRKAKQMKPKIDATRFGSITIAGETYEHDVIIRLGGKVKKRKKKLSKAIYGTSHRISLDEAEHIFDEGAEELIIDTGQTGLVELSEEAAAYFNKTNCQVKLVPTPEAIQAWNRAEGKVIALFHVTC